MCSGHINLLGMVHKARFIAGSLTFEMYNNIKNQNGREKRNVVP